MSIIPQFGFLYNAKLKDNLDPEGLIPREEIQKKINDTHLRIRDNKPDEKKEQQDEDEEEKKEDSENKSEKAENKAVINIE